MKRSTRVEEDLGRLFAGDMRSAARNTAFMLKAEQEGTVYYVCQMCGHIHRDSIPKRCPVCKAVPGRFKRIG